MIFIPGGILMLITSLVFGSFWLGLSNLFSIAALAVVYGAVFKVDDLRKKILNLATSDRCKSCNTVFQKPNKLKYII